METNIVFVDVDERMPANVTGAFLIDELSKKGVLALAIGEAHTAPPPLSGPPTCRHAPWSLAATLRFPSPSDHALVWSVGWLAGCPGPKRLRLVTHYEVTDADVRKAIVALDQIMQPFANGLRQAKIEEEAAAAAAASQAAVAAAAAGMHVCLSSEPSSR